MKTEIHSRAGLLLANTIRIQPTIFSWFPTVLTAVVVERLRRGVCPLQDVKAKFLRQHPNCGSLSTAWGSWQQQDATLQVTTLWINPDIELCLRPSVRSMQDILSTVSPVKSCSTLNKGHYLQYSKYLTLLILNKVEQRQRPNYWNNKK